MGCRSEHGVGGTGVISRKRNLDAVREREEEDDSAVKKAGRITRIRNNPRIFQPFPIVPGVAEWRACFLIDEARYPFLIVLAPSRAGKAEYAKSLFENALEVKVGKLEQFPDSMRAFSRHKHDGLVLDDVRDLLWVVTHQEKLQAKYDVDVEFGTTPGGTCAYKRDMFAVPIVVTINYSTKNLELLDTDDFLGNPENRLLVTLPARARASA